jgi:hypothetical protein
MQVSGPTCRAVERVSIDAVSVAMQEEVQGDSPVSHLVTVGKAMFGGGRNGPGEPFWKPSR